MRDPWPLRTLRCGSKKGTSILMERSSDALIRTEEGTTVLYSFAYFFIRLP